MTQIGNFGDASSISTKVPICFPKNNVHYEFRDFEWHNIQLICPTKTLEVGLSIRFGRSISISVGQSGTPTKSVGYQPNFFFEMEFYRKFGWTPTKTVDLRPIFDQ
jgi:hypothetical protein